MIREYECIRVKGGLRAGMRADNGWIWRLGTLVLFLANVASAQRVTRMPTVEEMAEFDTNYTGKTRPNGELSVFQYTIEQDQVVRITMRSPDANLSVPLLTVFREPATIISAQLPIVIKNYMYNETARTICPFSLTSGESMDRNVTVSVELSSYRPVQYQFSASIVQDFKLSLDKPLISSASASQPVFYLFEFPRGLDEVVIWVDSNSSICMTVSIQKAECPVFDLDNNIISGGMRQTVSRAGSLTVERRFFQKFFVIFVIRPDDNDCSEMMEIIPSTHRYTRPREKTFTVSLQAPAKDNYFIPLSVTFAGIIAIWVIGLIFMIAMGIYEKRVEKEERERLLPAIEEDGESGEHIPQENEDLPSTSRGIRGVVDETSRLVDETSSIASYDLLVDSRDKFIARQNLNLTVSDLSLKTWKQRERKYNRYVVSLVTIALFYGLPVVQLVLSWQDNVRLSGNLDLCWYNFRCARPFFVFFAFNNVMSNIGYIALGALFLLMVKEREFRQRQLWKNFPLDLQNNYGLPQHNGLMYAIGLAIVMEGVLSASYHICPSSSNYQFDTSFMYIIGMLGMLKIYQLRHPDINANAHVALAFAAFFILLAMLGVYLNCLTFWIFFAIAYIFSMAAVSVEFYFKGLWRLHPMEIFRSMQYAFYSSRWCSCLIPAHKSRFAFLFLGNAINLAMVTVGVVKRPKDFPSFLLFPFIANLFLYLFYYIIMKFLHRETLRSRAIVFLFFAFLCWLSASWFFIHNVADWSETPATSRELNHDCILLQFYDNHDVWHFLSSIALFMSFSLLNCIDDDLQWVRRDRIAVF